MLTGSRRAQLAERLERVFAEERGGGIRREAVLHPPGRTRGGMATREISGDRSVWDGKSSGRQDTCKTLTRPEKDEGAGKIGQQLHNPMFFQIIPGSELPAAAGLHRA